MKIGIVGFSRNGFDKTKASEILKKVFGELNEQHSSSELIIVSGYTNCGVPKIAYTLADELGFKTVGFSAAQAKGVRSGVYPVTETIIVGSKFGDESEAFVEYIDVLVRVGGGPQSRKEVELYKSLGKSELYEFEVEWYA